ncbi:MAG: cysteine--tRNA ligase [Candidatus Delongbacteria bacterium]|nr:cysteine--tRNA ligase [Candidatus Delongbacteria bacterium]MBN2833416.1 cysteine--tRNA ligase [Candidatus Delongbacteria bacterium]
MKIYNSYTNSKEIFKPVTDGIVNIYSCGPTVYSYAQIGNFSSFLMADLLVRYLKYKGYTVNWVQNITDVGHLTDDSDDGEDKMEKASKKENKTPWEIARFYEEAFLKDASLLNITKANFYPRATEHITEMINMIEKLVSDGYAYETEDGVYFDITKFKNYGKLSGNTLDSLNAGSRIDINSSKRNPQDFAIWKKLIGENSNHIMKWDSPWGLGFPGWHIECSAMSRKYLGDTLDFHTGGEDNKFPHHECEIAQSEAFTGKKYVNYWLHKSHILLNSEKMAKSTGNFYTVSDLVEKGYDPKAIRFTFLSAHYRSKLNFTYEAVTESAKQIDKFNEFIQFLLSFKTDENSDDNSILSIIKSTSQQFEKGLDDDLNISVSLAALNGFIKSIKKNSLKTGLKHDTLFKIIEFLKKVDTILCVMSFEKEKEKIFTEKEMEEINRLNMLRLQYREDKNFIKADEIRDTLIKMGVKINDNKV